MGRGSSPDDKAPSLSKWLREPLCIPKIAAAPFRTPVKSDRVGGGRPAIVLPGMASGDSSTALLRNSLREAGYEPSPAGLGRNLTITRDNFASLETLLASEVQRTGKPALLLGWSLGGLYARVLAQRHPDQVALVATLGTPFSGDRHANNAWRIYELLADHTVAQPPLPDDPAIKPDVHTIAFWSPKDGVIAPRCARGEVNERDEAIELPFRHFEMGCSRPAVRKILNILNDRIRQLG